MPPSPSICHVFTPDWVAEQQLRYGSFPPHSRPKFYNLWTAAELRSRRGIVERWVDLLPPEKRQRVVPRLRAPDQYEEARNELAVGDSFRQMGHAVEFEVNFQGQTPDWLVRPVGTGEFLVEVVSSRPSEAKERCDEGWERFRQRVQSLPGCAHLSIDPPFDTEEWNSDQEQREILRQLQDWLGGSPEEGAEISINGIGFQNWGEIPGLDHVSACVPFTVNVTPLLKSVKEKASKYKSIIQQERLPLVVCVVPDFVSGRGVEELAEVVFGRQRCRIHTLPQGRVRTEHFRASNGLFQKYPSLSAVTVSEIDRDQVSHVFLHNPSATFPLASSAFPGASVRGDEFWPLTLATTRCRASGASRATPG